MEGAATVMASPTPDPYTDATHRARHASPPADPRGATDPGWQPWPGTQGQETPPRPQAPAAEPSPFEQGLPDLRTQVVNGLIRMNWNHANQAWQRRRRDPLSPHVLVFFYTEPAGGQPRYELRTAARLFLAADGQRLAKLLYDMTGVIHEHL